MLKTGQVLKRFFTEEKAQGATEYILILVAIVAVVLLFREKIYEIVGNMLSGLNSKVGEAIN